MPGPPPMERKAPPANGTERKKKKRIARMTTYGGQELPPVLSEERQAELCRLLPDPDARQTLIERNLRLVVHVASKYSLSEQDLDDLVSIGTIGLIKAIDNFDVSKKVKLSSFAATCIANEIKMHFRKERKIPPTLCIDDPLPTHNGDDEICLSDILGTDDDIVTRQLEEESDRQAAIEALEQLPDVLWSVIALQFGLTGMNPMGQNEIAAWLGCSRTYVSRLETKARRIMRDIFEQNGLIEPKTKPNETNEVS